VEKLAKSYENNKKVSKKLGKIVPINLDRHRFLFLTGWFPRNDDFHNRVYIGALDSILPDGSTNWGSAIMLILNGTKVS
jgi:hypothetical protein